MDTSIDPVLWMRQVPALTPAEKLDNLRRARQSVVALLEEEPDEIARMASTAAVLYACLPQVSFAGFYRIVEPEMLVIGPYQGPIGCLRIPFGKGVCGSAARTGRSLLVADVHAFPGHIACDVTARSELAIPVWNGERTMIGVLDLDSRELAAFDDPDRVSLESLLEEVFAKRR